MMSDKTDIGQLREVDRQCTAIYDYEYQNKNNDIIRIHEGDQYILLDETNADWWHVQSPVTHEDFYVPAMYVHVTSNAARVQAFTDVHHDKEGAADNASLPSPPPDYRNRTPPPDYLHDNEHDVSHNVSTQSFYKRSLSDGEQVYANFDVLRAVQHVPQTPPDDDYGGDYMNLSMIQASLNKPPKPNPKHFVRAMTDTWQVYIDPESGRHYFFNSLTLELTWKPPRTDQASSVLPGESTNDASMYKGSNHSCLPSDAVQSGDHKPPHNGTGDKPLGITTHGQGWRENTSAKGDPVYVNDSTNEKWYSSIDEGTGRLYFYQEGSKESAWNLPQASMTQSLHVSNEPHVPEPKIDHVRDRYSKSQSMYIENGRFGGDSSRTLTPSLSSFNPLKDSTKQHPLPNFVTTQVFLQSYLEQPMRTVDLQGPKDGFLNKAKVLEGGKKVKKNWTNSYVLLTGSNLVFYKDQKSTQQKPGFPHGRPEFMVSLHGCSVQFDARDKSSKKNVIMLTVNTTLTQYLLQCDDYYKIHNWYIALNETIDMLNHGLEIPTLIQDSLEKQPHPHHTDTGASVKEKKSNAVGRSESMNTTSEEDRTRIRSRLRQFITRRPTADSLKARGIIKDAVFGADLRQLCDRDQSSVPKFVRLCVTTIEERGLDMDGLYRLCGNVSQVQKLRHMIDQDQWHAFSDPLWDINVLTGALKLFFRELKEPLFPYDYYDRLVSAVQVIPTSARLKAFRDILHALPKCNSETVKYFFAHLVRVTKQCKSNRMEPHNLAIVFGPTLLWPKVRNNLTMAVSTVYQNRIIEFLLLEYENVYR